MQHRKATYLDNELYDYLVAHGTPPDAVQHQLVSETKERVGEMAKMLIAPEQGAFITILTRLLKAQHALEVGTFTGYSALCMARGLPSDGTLLCCDVSEEWTSIARKYWEKADVSRKITLRLAPALETLRALPLERKYDICFIDADKENQLLYYEEIIKRMNRGGAILVDNALLGGKVTDLSNHTPEVVAVRKQNAFLAQDDRVDCVMLPIADGLTLLRVN